MNRPALLALALVSALCLPPGSSYAAPPAAEAPTEASTEAPVGCADPVFPEPVRADSAAASRAGLGETGDPTVWLDTCGEVYYRESLRVGPHAVPTAEPATAVPAAAGVLGLSSRPSSNRTIYLDFTGHRTANTAWNRDFGVNAFTSPPFQVDGPTSTAFSAVEKEQIRRAWETVAEDYAPFDVNVTTKDPGQAAITRSSASDRKFGTRVVVTAGGPLYQRCFCGGIAYLGTFDLAGRQSPVYQPTFVFTNGSTDQGWLFAENISHEAGHNLGLDHDGRGREEYYFGSQRWAPIMGASFDKLSQFSRGEYERATNTQNDLAIMTRHGIAARPDDHGDAAGGATPLPGTDARRAAGGVVSTSVDKDAFSFTPTADGPRTITVDPTGGATNLDVQLTLLGSDGAVLATVNPAPSGDVTRPSPAWLRARWTGDVEAGRRYTVLVDGVGYGDPRTQGWSGYGSLGAYRVAVTAG
ncbi:hypothetical protein [uncultured Nocardioides sp.]|uniref:hypothetical protein n=1 Tax=uncultured Nocardioides sp. TaxID=198441 RepID=UPI00260EDE71|nr:hypothetical protein [uncultured Nocardioides sp.]